MGGKVNYSSDSGLKRSLFFEEIDVDVSAAAVSAIPADNNNLFSVLGHGAFTIEAFSELVTGSYETVTLTFTKCIGHPSDTVSDGGNVFTGPDGKKYIKTASTATIVLTAEGVVKYVVPEDFSQDEMTRWILVEISIPSGTHRTKIWITAIGA